ncbi:MAG: MCE family protein [Bacteroidales bacterium]|jgi:phospholipid/cholesterol/gamma-HCH transport system substrate-binding protein|nr:MCE family protein [Bacteroidales bacterium]MDD3736773.1 MlaD family protein [Bacteroidales bacterium]NLD64260.1 MCE family protein [Bacteroidales bacterium]HNT92232.1 MlaD family protein [Bacteroidales bacterium]HOO66159.1 MlaD family protein [Bacteroidales bacterium]
MKISHEVKVGAVALITIIAFILMFEFLKGTALFTSTDTYHIVYDNIAGLTESNPVEINGYQAGVVQDVKLINDGSGRILVSLSVDKHFNIPMDTEAEITTATLIAGMKIILRMGDSNEMCHNHDTLSGYVAASILDRLSSTITPLEGNITNMIVSLDSVISALNDVFTPGMTADIRSTMANVSSVTSSLKEVSNSSKDELITAIEDLQAFTSMLSANSATLDSTIKNISGISDAVAAADMGATLGSLKSSLTNLEGIVKGISQGEGTAGKFIANDSLYTNLSNTLYNLDMLLRDMKENPKKYVHFSLFGKKQE